MKFSVVTLLSHACNHYSFLYWDEIRLFDVVSFDLFRSNIFQNGIFFENTISLQKVSWNIMVLSKYMAATKYKYSILWKIRTTLLGKKSCSLQLNMHKIFFGGTTTLDHSIFLSVAISLRFLFVCQNCSSISFQRL